MKEPNFNFDSLENTTAGKILREQSAKVDEKMVKKAVARINKNRKKMGTDGFPGKQKRRTIPSITNFK